MGLFHIEYCRLLIVGSCVILFVAENRLALDMEA